MKHLPEGMKEHISGEVTSLCRCWILERKDGMRLGFTDHDEDILIEGVVCERQAGFERANFEDTLGLNVDSQEVSGALQSERITDAEIQAGKYDNARAYIYLVNWMDPSQYLLERIAAVGEIVREDTYYKMELRGRVAELDQSKGNHFVKRCQVNLGDSRCRVQLDTEPYSAQGTIHTIGSSVIVTVSGLETYDSGWFRGGVLSWLSGANEGTTIELADHIHTGNGTVLHLWEPLVGEISVGDRFLTRAGCDKHFSTCREKFSNVHNFRGFPHIPGNDFALGHAGNSQIADGGPIIP